MGLRTFMASSLALAAAASDIAVCPGEGPTEGDGLGEGVTAAKGACRLITEETVAAAAIGACRDGVPIELWWRWCS